MPSVDKHVTKQSHVGTSLVVPWLRICIPMQGTQVQTLIRELRSQCHEATNTRVLQLEKPVCLSENQVQAKKKKLSHAEFIP